MEKSKTIYKDFPYDEVAGRFGPDGVYVKHYGKKEFRTGTLPPNEQRARLVGDIYRFGKEITYAEYEAK